VPRPWLIVSGDFVKTGGMDRANLALAQRLVERGIPVHLVAHRVDEALARNKLLTFHRVPRPGNMHFPASFLLTRRANALARRLRDALVVANGGNCPVGNINWVHYLHVAWDGGCAGGLVRSSKQFVERRWERRRERLALTHAERVICNSHLTAQQVTQHIGIPRERINTVNYGADARRFGPIMAEERRFMRSQLGLDDQQTCVAFIGALGDERKNFDTLFAAWRQLRSDAAWRDAVLLVIGQGAQLPFWKARAEQQGDSQRFRFLGLRSDVAELLAACDLLVHPARYEAFGLSPFEALCRGVPVLVSAAAGVSEVIPARMSNCLVQSYDDVAEWMKKLQDWKRECAEHRTMSAELGTHLRARSWDDMADEIIEIGHELHEDKPRQTALQSLTAVGQERL